MIKYVFLNSASAKIYFEIFNTIEEYKSTANSILGPFWRLKVSEEDLEILTRASELALQIANTSIYQVIKRFDNWKKAKYYIQLLNVSSKLIKLKELKEESNNEN